MTLRRRDVMLAGLGAGLTVLIDGPSAEAREDSLAPYNTYGVVPADGAIAQTATLQEAANAAARSGIPLYLPAGTYSTGRLTLESGTHIQGVPGLTVLRYVAGGAIIETEGSENIRLTGLVLDGGGTALGEDGTLLRATEATHFDISECRLQNSAGDGLTLRKVGGRIANCEIGDVAGVGLFSAYRRQEWWQWSEW
jgi:uncharacterized secreted repeat protein (TIGR03808 family)